MRLGLLTPLLVAVSCVRPRTEIVATIDSELLWGPGQQLQSVSVEVRTGDAAGLQRSFRLFPLGSESGRMPLPLVVGILPDASRVPNDPTPVWIEVLGCGGSGCTRADAVVSQRAIVQFRHEETLDLRLFLAAACVGNPCDATQRCDPSSGMCVSARVAPPPVGMMSADAGTVFVGHDVARDVAADSSDSSSPVERDAAVWDDAPSTDSPVTLPADVPIPEDVRAVDVPVFDVSAPVDVPTVRDVSVADANPFDADLSDAGPPDTDPRGCPTALALGLFDTGADGWVFDALWRHGGGAMVAGSTTRFSSTYTQSLTSGANTDLSACAAAVLTFTVRLDDNPTYETAIDRSERLTPQCSGDGGFSWLNLTPNPWPPNQSPCATSYCSGGYNASRAFPVTAQSITLPSTCVTTQSRIRFRASGASAWRLENPGWAVDSVRIN